MTDMRLRDRRSPGAPIIPRDGWELPPWNRWTNQHVREMTATAPIWRGDGPVRPLPESLQPLGDIMIDFREGKRSVDEFLNESSTDGFLVLHRGRIIFERYMNELAPHKQHLIHSATKSFIGTLAGIVEDKGLLDVKEPVTEYLPELAATAFRGATVQQLLDMTGGVFFDESTNEDSHIRKLFLANGWYPHNRPDWPRTVWDLILSLDKAARPHGASFHYCNITTNVLGCVLERASGLSLADLMSQEIWAQMGAAEDAYITVDHAGLAAAGGGLCATLRDLGRFAMLLVDGGARDGRQIIPHSWIEETRSGGVELSGSSRQSLPNGAYHNHWWIEDRRCGTLWARGQDGQIVFIDPDAEFVAVKLSSLTNDENYTQRRLDERPALLAIRDALSTT
ncbi:serine hydrolase domain-containing protein [Phyllobacterium zundukense]|uniref:Beta-lactamase family protein n=1 Tax=Phyllobacterium zundukense TaxID=1867719 RepID=A0ACD4CVM4_9HYPH|nr:serine hydrolase [Phyllobacterium zundukense]UXN57634.1 beta-lactamase family protein [Phyllobacterium zundukense]